MIDWRHVRRISARFGICAITALVVAAPVQAQNTTAAEIDAAETAWRASAPSEYVITLVVRCFCMGASGRPLSFHVKDGKAGVVGVADERALQLYERFNTVEKLFIELRRQAAREPFRMAISFHQELRYPASADVDPRQLTFDDELRFQVLDLRAGSQPPDRVSTTEIVNVPMPMARASAPPIAGRAASVPLREGRVAEFVADVPAITENGRCENFPSRPIPPAVKMLTYAFGPPVRPTRRIVVMIAEDGRVVRYSDIRGDLRAIMDPSVTAENSLGRVTALAIDFDKQSAVLRNEHGGRPANALRALGPDVVVADNLGNPSDVAKLIRTACER